MTKYTCLIRQSMPRNFRRLSALFSAKTTQLRTWKTLNQWRAEEETAPGFWPTLESSPDVPFRLPLS